jgi:hypothetical protein
MEEDTSHTLLQRINVDVLKPGTLNACSFTARERKIKVTE